MRLPDLTNGPPPCEGRKECPNKAFVLCVERWICSDCYGHYLIEKSRKAEKEAEEIFG